MKKILVLTSRFPYPVIGGDRLRIYQLCKTLSTKYNLTLLSLCANKEEMTMDLPDDIFQECHRVFLPKWRSMINTVLALPSKTPLQVAYYNCKKFRQEIEKLIPLHDATLSHLIRVGDYMKNTLGKHVIEMTDAISLNYKRIKQSSRRSDIRSIVFSYEQKRLESYERNVLSGFQFASLVSEVDAKFLFPDNKHKDKVLVCANGVDTDALPYSYRPIEKDRPIELIFIGNLSSLQNFDAAHWFAKNVMPELNKIGNFNLKIVGRISEKHKTLFNNIPYVYATGGVASIVDATSSGHIGVCPMRLGAGIQNKVLEYMSLGMPCITSKIGYEGINAKKGSEILIADEINEYVSVISKLITDPALFKLISENARYFVEKEFSWQSRLNPFLVKFDRLFD